MYTGYGFRDFEIGDVDVVAHEGLYHLFHLTLPNHDYIAHAVSEDGFNWRRVKNALFISDPEAWDDDMLWTMHISPDPYRSGSWRMFYTGLCMQERGRIQRVGLARSSDLYHWHKITSDAYPLEVPGPHYESNLDEGRHWVSFRDPFCFHDDGDYYLVAAGRVNCGPIIRRGCVVLAQEVAENEFEFQPPLFHPSRYDDIEVPNLFQLGDNYYLIGSIREDVKVHYWYAPSLKGPYQNYADNVLLPQGNYAARVCFDGERWLVWNFFFRGLHVQGDHLLVPPKELVADEAGELRLKSFFGFDQLVKKTIPMADLMPLEPLFENPHGTAAIEDSNCYFGCESGLEGFLLQGEYEDFRLSGRFELQGRGKFGFVLRLDENGDGYYVSLDVTKGIVQIRAWKHQDTENIEEAFLYEQLQAVHYVPVKGPYTFCLIASEQYLEFSLNGHVQLTLADNLFDHGRVGFYTESAGLRVSNLQLQPLKRSPADNYPQHSDNY